MDELQGTPEFISKRKAQSAATKAKGLVMVEDVSLCFNSLKGLPGPYIKSFLDGVGREGLYKMISAFDDKSAYA